MCLDRFGDGPLAAATDRPHREPGRQARLAPVDTSPAIELQDVSFAYAGTVALEGVTLSIPRGDRVAVVGPNGSGKSTLIKLSLGLLNPDQGSVRVFGTDMRRFSQWQRIGYVPQVASGIHSMFPITVAEVVAQGRYNGFSPLEFWRTRPRPDVDAALQLVEMYDFRRRRIGELSTGQQQRTLIARALIRKPDLLVMDEPVSGVDAQHSDDVNLLLRQLNRNGMTIVTVSHDIGAVVRESRTVVFVNGTIGFHGPAAEVGEEDLARLFGFGLALADEDL